MISHIVPVFLYKRYINETIFEIYDANSTAIFHDATFQLVKGSEMESNYNLDFGSAVFYDVSTLLKMIQYMFMNLELNVQKILLIHFSILIVVWVQL